MTSSTGDTLARSLRPLSKPVGLAGVTHIDMSLLAYGRTFFSGRDCSKHNGAAGRKRARAMRQTQEAFL